MRSGRLYRQTIFWAMFLTLFFSPVAAGAQKGAGNLEKVTLQLKWHHQFQFAGYYAAKAMGFYAQQGFDVKIMEGGPDIKVQDVVTSGTAAFGILGSELLFFRSKGENLVVLAPIMQNSLRVIIARKDSNIFSPHDLSGNRSYQTIAHLCKGRLPCQGGHLYGGACKGNCTI